MIELTTLKCPECGASLDIPEERDHIFCQYCGTKILLNNSNEQIVRHIDEAAIKQAENDKIAEQNRIELETNKLKMHEREKKFKLILIGIIIFAMIIIYILSRINLIGRLAAAYSELFCIILLGMVWQPNK